MVITQGDFPELVTKALAVHQRLKEFYGTPEWREPLQPLDELVSTILSQNTNDRNRDQAFQRLKQQFPNWEDARDAPVEEIVSAIQIAGLANQKGPRIQQVLRQISEERGELSLEFLKELPADVAKTWLMRFKGVGPKTASIVLQFALGKQAFPVDTHIYRVSGRLGLRPARVSVEKTHVILAGLFPSAEYGPAHLNLIRLGREICQARKPRCKECPLQQWCNFYHESTRSWQ